MAWHTYFMKKGPVSVEVVPAVREVLGIRRGLLFMDTKAYRLYVDGQELALRARLFKLLEILIEHEGNAVSRDELFIQLCGDEYESCSNLIDVCIAELRRILKQGGLPETTIRTIRGVGYRFSLEG
jgi:two-component system alkaline phosphatase synthesis response regulator PhoP